MIDNQPIEQTDNKLIRTLCIKTLEKSLEIKPKSVLEIEVEKMFAKIVVTRMENILDISTLQHNIDYKNKFVELKTSNLFEKIIDVIDRNMPTNKDEDKRFINLMEKVVDILHTDKPKQLNNGE